MAKKIDEEALGEAYNRALALEKAGDVDAAVAAYEEVLAIDPDDLDPRFRYGAAIQRERFFRTNPELVVLESSRDIRMGARIDVGIDAERNPGTHLTSTRDGLDAIQFCCGFDVEAEDSGGQRLFDFLLGLADAGKHDPLDGAAGRNHACQLAA